MNYIQKFFILCSGSNFSVLNKCKTDWNKHSGFGAVVFFTALFATISASYALLTAFNNITLAIIFGVLWGFMILNLDRFIISSIKKTSGFLKQFTMAIPRLVLATFLGIVISKPLELKIFEKEINKQLNVIIERNKRELHANMNERFKQQTKNYKTERDSLNSKYRLLREEYNLASKELEKEIVGTSTETTTGKVGYGSNAKRKEEIKNQKKREIEAFEKENKLKMKELDKEILTIYSSLQEEIKSSGKIEQNFNGFAARMQALDELGKNNKIIAIASIFIMGIFISLEIAPVFVKLLASKGPYDELLDAHENEFSVFAKEKIKKSEFTSEQRIKNFIEKL